MDEKTYGARTEANRSPPGSARWRMRGAGRPSASPGPRSARASPGWCGCSGYPRPARRGRPAAGARRREPGVVRLGEPLARISPPGAVRAEDQPRPLTRPDRDQRGQRHPRVMAAGHRHHRGLAGGGPRCGPSAASGPGRTRLRSRARRPGPPPRFYDRPGVLPPPGDLLLVPLRRPPRRDLHGPPDPVQQHVHPGSVYSTPNRRQT